MARKPPCRICRTRRYRKNAMGFYVCEFGHQLEGFQEEEGEFDLNSGTLRHRRIHKQDKKRKRKDKASKILHGAKAEKLVVQSVQLVLRKQVHVLVHQLKFPPEFETVVREYWMLYINSIWRGEASTIPTSNIRDDTSKDIEDTDDEAQDADSEIRNDSQKGAGTSRTDPTKTQSGRDPNDFKDKVATETSVQDEIDKMKEYAHEYSSSSESSAGEESDSGSHNNEDAESESSDDAVDEDDGNNGDDGKRDSEENISPGRKLPWTAKHKENIPHIQYTICICFIAARHLRLPVILGDFYRWMMDGTLPYYSAFYTLPLEIRIRAGPSLRGILTPSHKGITKLHRTLTKLIGMFRSQYDWKLKTPSLQPFLFRFIKELMLPGSRDKRYFVFQFTKRRPEVLSSSLLKSQGLRNAPIGAMAIVMFLAKLFLGLDGKERYADQILLTHYHLSGNMRVLINHMKSCLPLSRRDQERMSWINTLPDEQEWIRHMDAYDQLRAQTTIPAQLGEFEELVRFNPDLYLHYIKNTASNRNTKGFHQILDVFENTDYRQRSHVDTANLEDAGRQMSFAEAFIRHLFKSVQQPSTGAKSENTVDEPPPLRTGEGFVYYSNYESGASYLGQYERLLAYAKLDIFQWDKHQFAKQDFTIPDSFDTLERIDYDKVSREEFIKRFEEKNRPVVIRGVTNDWGACKNWNVETFLKKYNSQSFKVGEDDDGNNVYIKAKYFLKYAQTDGLKDDSPLYIFDSGFVKRKLTSMQKKRMRGSSLSSSSSSEQDSPPQSTLRKGELNSRSNGVDSGSDDSDSDSGSDDDKKNGSTGTKRTRSRSGSPRNVSRKVTRVFGKRSNSRRDENGVGGADSGSERRRSKKEEHASTLLNDFTVPKYFKDDLFQLAGDRRRPPFRWFVVGGPRSGTGIHIDPLGIPKDVYDPPMKPFDREAVSWFHHVYPRFAANNFELGKKYGMIQVIQRPGETMFVPGGWPHIVMNLDFTIAVTQNFCSATNFEAVWLMTRHARPKLARKFHTEIERMFKKTGRCFYKDLLDKCRSLSYVPMLPMSTDDSSSSSSSSSDSDSIEVTSTDSESDIGEICMCHKCKKKRRKELRRASKGKETKSTLGLIKSRSPDNRKGKK
ncbi:hypothetical protein BGW38_010739 [Lunasporangiospora selenospora]|uniref:JmjC domain-containing protein n=1 Tax=Lunasporangiospora selenospora TaxID=979761 RepID=A0A9P6KI97_9FUNG|nr:hypothetical protein BGW38_010739 [Lunasporangiospora selenospora]